MSGQELRKAYATTVRELFDEHPDVYALEADLSSSMGTSGLRHHMGAHYVNVGIMEAHMVSTAAGLSLPLSVRSSGSTKPASSAAWISGRSASGTAIARR